MLNVMKKAALDALEASSPLAVMAGTVTGTNPLEVNVDQRFTLAADFLIVPESVTRLTLNIGGADHIIRAGLQTGDPVILLRVQGGQKYLILDKAVNG